MSYSPSQLIYLGSCLVGTEKDGKRRLLLSLKQMEFLQLYIHEMRLADPVWVEHLSKLHDAAPGEEVEFHEEVGPPAYPEGGEWVPLPNDFYRREAFTSMVGFRLESRSWKLMLDRKRFPSTRCEFSERSWIDSERPTSRSRGRTSLPILRPLLAAGTKRFSTMLPMDLGCGKEDRIDLMSSLMMCRGNGWRRTRR